MANRERDYQAYLLRLWRAGTEEGGGWRASLQDARTGRRVGFACLEDAVAFLRQRMGEGGAGSGDGTDGECARQGPS